MVFEYWCSLETGAHAKAQRRKVKEKRFEFIVFLLAPLRLGVRIPSKLNHYQFLDHVSRPRGLPSYEQDVNLRAFEGEQVSELFFFSA